jgi:MFS family permease
MGFVSRLSSEDEQGRVMGLASSAVSLASVVGPIVAGGLFSISARGSYAAAAGVAVAIAVLSMRSMRMAPSDDPRRLAASSRPS